MRVTAGQIDRIIGCNIRRRRLARGMTQQELASDIGVSFQQLQKYEAGTNRVSAGMLFRISVVLGVSLYAFFEAGPGDENQLDNEAEVDPSFRQSDR